MNGYAEVDLGLKGLRYKLNVGINKYTRRDYSFVAPYYFSSTSQNSESRLSEGTSWENDWLIENTVNYDNTFGVHTISALLGYSAQRNGARSFSAGRSNLPEGLDVIDAGSTANQTTSGSMWLIRWYPCLPVRCIAMTAGTWCLHLFVGMVLPSLQMVIVMEHSHLLP